VEIRPTRTVVTDQASPKCGAAIQHSEVGYALTEPESLTWLVARRYCSAVCVLDETTAS